MSANFANVMIGLDELFDTRLATLFRMDREKTEALIRSGQYLSRVYDEFEGFDTEAFKAAYASRDVKTLKGAMITEAYDFLNFFVDKTIKAAGETPFVKQPKILLNTYPYTLSESAINNIVLGLALLTHRECDIEVVSMSNDDLTPKWVKENLVLLVKYDYAAWLERQAVLKGFDTVMPSEVLMNAPAMVASEEAWEKVKACDIFLAIQANVEMFIHLVLHPVSKFSVDWQRHMKYQKTKA